MVSALTAQQDTAGVISQHALWALYWWLCNSPCSGFFQINRKQLLEWHREPRGASDEHVTFSSRQPKEKYFPLII